MQKTILIGNLGNDPEVRNTRTGTPVCSFSVATTERWKDQQGNQQEKSEWHRIIAWGALANICSQYLSKGTKVYIEGKNKTRSWKDQNGVEHYITEIHAGELEILSPRNGNNGSTSSGNNQQRNQQNNRQQNQNGHNTPPGPPPGYPTGTGEDVPF